MRNEELIVKHMILAHTLAKLSQRKSLPMHVEIDDLYSESLGALVAAGERWDHSGGASFKNFVQIRISGRLIEYMQLSNMQWSHVEALEDVHLIDGESWRSVDVRRAISGLPARWRRLLFLRFWLGFTHQEAAQDMRIGVNRAWQMQQQAFARLREALA